MPPVSAVALAADPNVEVVVELIGGSEGPARALVEAALAAGKPVVTANKALLATHGAALAKLSEAKATPLAYEAAVAGGIPAIKALREGLAGNRISRVAGICCCAIWKHASGLINPSRCSIP